MGKRPNSDKSNSHDTSKPASFRDRMAEENRLKMSNAELTARKALGNMARSCETWGRGKG